MRQIKTTNTSCLDTLLPDFSTAIRSVTVSRGTVHGVEENIRLDISIQEDFKRDF